jgi:NTE family protein
MIMDASDRIKVGLALGGGGVRGLAHIGVLKVLVGEKIPVACIAGTSMGGVIGAYFAAGRSPAELEELAKQTGRFREVSRMLDPNFTFHGLLSGKRVKQRIGRDLGDEITFEDLRIPLSLLAVDLNTGREVIITEGKVVDALRATISVPAVFVPYDWGNFRLVDGGVLNNVPADVVRKMGADVVIAVDVLPDFTPNTPGDPPIVMPLDPRPTPRLYRTLWHVQLMMISDLTSYRLRDAHPEVIIRPELPLDMDLFVGFERASVAIEAGQKAALAALPQIHAALGSTPAVDTSFTDNPKE